MAVNLSIKHVPAELVSALRDRAKGHHRSLQGELLSILEEAVRPRRLTVAELVQRGRQRGLSTGDDATAQIRAERDGR